MSTARHRIPTWVHFLVPVLALSVAGPTLPARASTPHPPTSKQVGDTYTAFVFATIADSHIRFDGGPDVTYLKAMDRAPALLANYVADINAHNPPVDFVIHLGDVTDLGRPDEFATAGSIMGALTRPLYPVVGNHDNFRSDAKAAWKAFAGRDSTNYAFDYRGFHFIVIDCTLDPYVPPYVNCGSEVRTWVAQNLAANSKKPTVVFSHFNMWRRSWNAMFDTTLSYAEYQGMPELREILEDAGNVVAVVNGHVHANRVEKHNGIYYIDVAATLVGPPSIRYFYIYPDRIAVTFEYISDRALAANVAAMCPLCCCCYDRGAVCDFIDGKRTDKEFVIWLGCTAGVPAAWPEEPGAPLALQVRCEGARDFHAAVASARSGTVDLSLHDVLGRCLGRRGLWKEGPELEVDLGAALAVINDLPPGVYFLRVSLQGEVCTAKIVLIG
jgi:predicted phosphodiesterase